MSEYKPLPDHPCQLAEEGVPSRNTSFEGIRGKFILINIIIQFIHFMMQKVIWKIYGRMYFVEYLILKKIVNKLY
ncbi:MAG: hypothetical protein ABII90_08890 [Bacteroidota bacterium]